MKKRILLFVLILSMIISILPKFSIEVSAITASDIKNQAVNTRKHIEKLSGYSSFEGYCGAHVSWQLYSLGITSAFAGKNGNEHYNSFTKQSKSSGGYPILLFPASQMDLGDTLNLLTKNGSVDAFNILVGFERGSTDYAGQTYGHAVFIHGIIDGTVYYFESYDTTIGGKYYNEGNVISCSISQFVNYYKTQCTMFDGIVYFGHPYMKKCTPKNICGSLKIKNATSAQTLPCSSSVNSDSENFTNLYANQEYEYVKEYTNSLGESWYQIKYGGGLLFVNSNGVEVISSQTPTSSLSVENVQSGSYYIKNGAYYINVLNDVTGTQSIEANNNVVGATHQFKLERIGDTLKYRIKSANSSKGYVLDCRWQNKLFTADGDEVILNQTNEDKDLSQAWTFEKFEDGYLIHVAGTPSVVLTREGNAICVKKNTKSANQIWKLNTEAVCSHEYEYKNNGNIHWRECNICGDCIEQGTHEWNYKLTNNNSILASEVSHYFYCHICDILRAEPHVYNSPCDALCSICSSSNSKRQPPHSYTNKNTFNASEHWVSCTLCQNVSNKTNHKINIDNNDEEHWSYCSECEYKSEISKHTFESWTVIEEASCKKEGKKSAQCYACPTTKIESIPKESHDYSSKSTEEYIYYTCNKCGDSYKESIKIESNCQNHSYGNWTTTKNATCNQAGERQRTCSDCGYTDIEKITMTHSFGKWVTTNFSNDVKTERRDCENCNEYETREVKLTETSDPTITDENNNENLGEINDKSDDKENNGCNIIFSYSSVMTIILFSLTSIFVFKKKHI